VSSALPCALAVLLVATVASAQSADGPSVPDYGVGTGVENRALVGKADSFAEGTKVYFLTRVVNGQAGDRVHHVWMREGNEVLSIGLSVGGSHWRTYSNKTLHPGSVGSWRVEVRDADGKVLASQDFTCTPAE
jgi:hypothetical protein